MKKLYSLTDRQFALIGPILREEKDTRGRKPKISDRHALEGVLYILREGCRWRAMPEAFGHWMTIFMRYKRWIERGVLWKVLMRLQKAGVLQVSVAFMDSSVVRAHRHAAGARKKGAARL
jgi:putative transposase